ncbi:MAG: nuclear transport factor 2 family protein [Pseudomonadota bacterium]
MSSSSNKERLRAAYKQWHDTKAGSVETWLEICSPNMVFLSSAMGREGMEFTEPCTCLGDVKRYFNGLNEDWDMIHYRVDDILGDGDMMVAVGSTAWKHKATGLSFEVAKADAWTFKDGKAVRFAEHYDAGPILEAIKAA